MYAALIYYIEIYVHIDITADMTYALQSNAMMVSAELKAAAAAA